MGPAPITQRSQRARCSLEPRFEGRLRTLVSIGILGMLWVGNLALAAKAWRLAASAARMAQKRAARSVTRAILTRTQSEVTPGTAEIRVARI
eukprot:8087022-Pyramimonas_sp.AAC.1